MLIIIIIIIITIIIIIIVMIIDILYSTLSTYNVEKRFMTYNQWTIVYSPYSHVLLYVSCDLGFAI